MFPFEGSPNADTNSQVIDLGGLIKSPQTGFKLQIGDRETTTLYASSTAEQISEAIIGESSSGESLSSP